MMMDTCFLVDIMRRVPGLNGRAARAKLERLHRVKLLLPVFSLCELRAGISASADPDRELERLERITEFMEVVYPSSGFAVIYGEAAAHLKRCGTPVPLMDLLIGVLAKSESVPILTRNTEHFSRIPGLVVEGY